MFELMDIAKVQQKHALEQKRAIAKNVSNVDRPNYRSAHVKDLSPNDFKTILKSTSANDLNRTNARHIPGSKKPAGAFKVVYDKRPSDISRSGNTVSLHDEMMKSAELSAASKMTRSFLKSFLGFFKLAARG